MSLPNYGVRIKLWGIQENTMKNQEKKVEDLHWEIQKWKSNLQFLEDELLFIKRLLDSYVFQPNTPNLFERLQDYKKRIKEIEGDKKPVRDAISLHENTLGGMLECTDSTCDLAYYGKHDALQSKVDRCLSEFQALKSEIFNYAGGILKSRKPTLN